MSNVCRVALVLVLALFAALAVKMHWRPYQSAVVPLKEADVPLAVAGYTALPDGAWNHTLEADAEKLIQQSQVVARIYRSEGDEISFLLVSGSGRTALHDPRLCLTGSGWRLSDAHTEPLPGTPIVMQQNEAATVSALPDTSLTYFYIVKGRAISSPTEIRVALLGSSLLGRDSAPVYFFRFIQPINPDPAQAKRNRAHMLSFAAEMWRRMQPKLRSA